MSAGTNYSRSTIDHIAGDIAVRVRALVADAQLFKAWLDTVSPEDLLALGYNQDEVDTLISSFSTVDGLGLLVAIYQGVTTLSSPIDFSLAATRLAGPVIR